MSLAPCCPAPATWRIAAIAPGRERCVWPMAPGRSPGACPVWGTRSRRVHSRYRRNPWEVPWGPWPGPLLVHARRFLCDAPSCPRRMFVEPFPAV
jgi:hypothetical protein